jgi:surface protein
MPSVQRRSCLTERYSHLDRRLQRDHTASTMDCCITTRGERRYFLGWLGVGLATLLSAACGRSRLDTASRADLSPTGESGEASTEVDGGVSTAGSVAGSTASNGDVSTAGNGDVSTASNGGVSTRGDGLSTEERAASSGRMGYTSSEAESGEESFGGSYPDTDLDLELPFESCDEFLAFAQQNTRANEFVFAIPGAEVQLPLVDGGSYDFEVDWGDGTRNVITSADALEARHVYDTDSEHVVRVRGLVRGWSYGNSLGNPATKLEIAQWGSLQLGDTDRQFENLSLSLCASDAPDLSQTDSLEGLFHGSRLSRRCPRPGSTDTVCDSLADLSQWDVSNITNMYELFAGAEGFSGELSEWDVSRVTNLGAMFASAFGFNGDLSGWDVSNATNMSAMFEEAVNFNADLSNWDVSNVTNMSAMFDSAHDFTGDLSRWDVSKVTDMSRMFALAQQFNSDISAWNVSSVESAHYMFYLASSFAGDLSAWDLRKVTDLSYLFYGCESFNSDLSTWDVSNVTDMSAMFSGATSFNADVSNWDVSQVTNMSDMFHFAYAFNRDLSTWDVSNVTNMTNMFFYATAFTGDVADWDVSSVTDMSYMFHYAGSFNGDVSAWNVTNVTDMTSMFAGTVHSRSNYDALLSSWSTLPVQSGVTFETTAHFSAGTAAAARTSLSAKGWTLLDAGEEP